MIEAIDRWGKSAATGDSLKYLPVIAVLVLYFGAAISLLPQFITDDFYIFDLLDRLPSLIVTEPDEKFYLYFRPVSVIYFRFLSSFFLEQAWMMKGVSAILLLISIVLTCSIIHRIARLFGRTTGFTVTAAAAISIALHPDVLQSVLWISNVNELLMTFFYLLSVHAILAIISGTHGPAALNAVLAVAAFVLSVLSKQQSLHLPLLLLLFLIMNRRPVGKQQISILWGILIFMILFGAVLAIRNIVLYLDLDPTGSVVPVIWKKPFALAGLLFHCLVPLVGLDLYGFFLNNQTYALALVLLVIPAVLVFRTLGPQQRQWLYLSVAVIVILFIPRLALSAGDRVNVLQVFTVWIMGAVMIPATRRSSKVISVGLCLLMVPASIAAQKELRRAVEFNEHADRSLERYLDQHPLDRFIIAYYHPLLPTGHSYFYHTRGRFGDEVSLQYSGVTVRGNLRWGTLPAGVKTLVSGDTLRLTMTNRDLNISQDRIRSPITITGRTSTARGYSSIEMLLPRSGAMDPSAVIAYSDSGWVRVQ